METENQQVIAPNQFPPPPSGENSPPTKLARKKIIIIVGVAVLVIILFLVVVIALNKKGSSNKPTTVTKTKIPMSQIVKPNKVISTMKLTAPKSWYVIHTQYYSVTVPVGWKPTIQPLQGGVAVIIQPAKAPEDPLLVVESYTVPVSIADKVALYQGMGLAKSTQKISSNEAVMLAGTWPTRTINGHTIKIPTQERLVYIPNGDSEFTLRMYYSNPQPQSIYEQILQRVISSFTINH